MNYRTYIFNLLTILKKLSDHLLDQISLIESALAGQRYTTWFLWKGGTAAEIRRMVTVGGQDDHSRATVYN